MTIRTITRLAVLALGTWTIQALAAPVDIDTANPQNGVYDIYSATFDPALMPCGAGSPSYCAFFHGDPPATRALVITPNPTTTTTGIPGGIGPPTPASASFLDLTLGAGNTSVTLNGGSIKFPVLIVTINSTTVVTATGAGFVFTTPQTTAVDANGRAEFLVDLTPATAVDFSTFSVVVTSCTGPLCALIPILTLDMIRYRLVIAYDPGFGSFTGSFIGQTANNSMVFANLNSGIPGLTITDPAAPTDDLQMQFGSVTQLTSVTRQITVTNRGGSSVLVGDVAQANPLAAPFAVSNDNCSNQTLLVAASCTFDVTFTPSAVGNFNDSLDIPSSAASVTLSVSGAGVAGLVPNMLVTDSVAPNSDLAVPFGNVSTGGQVDQTVTITNDGTADLMLGLMAMADSLQAPFSVQGDTCSNQTLAPAGTCNFGVRFEPTALGLFTDSLDIPSNADTPTAILTVSGTGIIAVPNIRITDPVAPDDDRQLSFENVRESGSFDRTITISNIGGADLVLGDMGQVDPLAAPFSIVAGEDHCSVQTLAPSGSCTVRLRFEPTAIGNFNDSFDVPSNDPDEPSVTVQVDGSGVEAPVPTEPSPSGAGNGFMAIDPATLLALGLLGGASRWRRRAREAGKTFF